MDDETLLRTMKNGLMIAGHEMGPVGDHWPAITALCTGLDEEEELHQRNLAVRGEMEFHLTAGLHELEEIAKDANEHDRALIMDFVKDIWENYYAALEPVDPKCATSNADDLVMEDGSNAFPKMKAAIHILQGLGGRS